MCCCCLLLHSAILRSQADSMRSHVMLHEWLAYFTILWSGVFTALACVNENAYVWAPLVTYTYFQKHQCKEHRNYLTRKVNAQVTHIHVTTFNAQSTTQFVSQRLPLGHNFLLSRWRFGGFPIHCWNKKKKRKCPQWSHTSATYFPCTVSKRQQSSLWSQRDNNLFTFSKMLIQCVELCLK